MRNNNQKDGESQQNNPPQKQIIPEKGEEYLRDIANIEDLPSPAEDADAEKVLQDEPDSDNLKK